MLMHNPPHPGKVLQEYMGQTDVTSFAEKIGVARSTLSRLLHGHAGISAPMALRLGSALKTSAMLWMNLQVQYDLWHAMEAQKKSSRAKNSPRKDQRVAISPGARTERVPRVRSKAA